MINKFIILQYLNRCTLSGLEEKDYQKLYNSKCPFCKEGKSWNRKKRFFILFDNEKCTCICHNCGYNHSFNYFLREYDNNLYKEYRKDLLKNNFFKKEKIKIKNTVKKKEVVKDILSKLQKIKNNKEAIEYLKKRKLPLKFVKQLYFTNNFMQFLHNNNLKKFKYIPKFDKRIVIPIYENNKLKYIQGRSIIPENKYRYINIELIKGKKIWNLDNIDWNKNVYAFEGIFDACFIKNSIAIIGGMKKIEGNNLIYVLDNDWKKNKEVRKAGLKLVNQNCKVCLMPSVVKYKDINDMIINGYKLNDIKMIINSNVYYGILAKLTLMLRSN